MFNKELKKLSRRELVDLLYQMKKNEEQMQEEIAALQQAVEDKRLRISVAGSIAEAAMDITNLMSTAQMTADLYLREISCMKIDAEEECRRMIEDARKKADKIVADGEKRLADLEERYQVECQKLQQLEAEMQRLEAPVTAEQERE